MVNKYVRCAYMHMLQKWNIVSFFRIISAIQWHALGRAEQAKYYDMARKEKELHMQLHPGWSARDNYAMHTKKKKKTKRDVIPHHHHQQAMHHTVAGLQPLKVKDDPGQQPTVNWKIV